jgi:spermidine synthase
VVQQSESPLLHLGLLRDMHAAMRGAGFADVKSLFFPQPVYPSGWWSATLARKGEVIAGFREEAVERRPFVTRYYNADIHRAALAQPEFFRNLLHGGDTPKGHQTPP